MRAGLIIAAAGVTVLAGCGREEKTASATANTKVEVNLPGFDTKVTLPGSAGDNINFKVNDVGLYPGSTVSSFKVDADATGNDAESTVEVEFVAPAEPAKVRDWFITNYRNAKVQFTERPDGLDGVSGDGDRIELRLKAAAQGRTEGEIKVRDKGEPAPAGASRTTT